MDVTFWNFFLEGLVEVSRYMGNSTEKCHVYKTNKMLCYLYDVKDYVKRFIHFVKQPRGVNNQISCNDHSHHTVPYHNSVLALWI